MVERQAVTVALVNIDPFTPFGGSGGIQFWHSREKQDCQLDDVVPLIHLMLTQLVSAALDHFY